MVSLSCSVDLYLLFSINPKTIFGVRLSYDLDQVLTKIVPLTSISEYEDYIEQIALGGDTVNLYLRKILS